MQPRILPDITYGDLPPVQIERNLQQGMDPIQEESSSMQAEPSQSAQAPTNKMDKKKWEQWNSAMKEEMKSLYERKVWDLVDLPKGCQSIKGR